MEKITARNNPVYGLPKPWDPQKPLFKPGTWGGHTIQIVFKRPETSGIVSKNNKLKQ
jgi:hypothetical protein